MMLAILRVRGRIGVREDAKITMHMTGFEKKHSLAIIAPTPSVMGMVKRSKDYLTWGEVSQKTVDLLKEKKGAKTVYHLAPPRRGFKSLKKKWPLGDLGKR